MLLFQAFLIFAYLHFTGSAKSASQRAMRATVRAMRVTRVMRVMRVLRATVQMLRIFICQFIYIRVRKFWKNFFLCFFFFLSFVFVIILERILPIQYRPRCAKKIKTIRKNLLRFKTSEKKKSEKNIRLHRYSNRYLLTHVIR